MAMFRELTAKLRELARRVAPGRLARAGIESLRGFAARICRCAAFAARAFVRGNGMNKSAATAFYGLLSFIPLLFLFTMAMGELYGETWSTQQILRRELGEIVPFVDETLFARIRVLVWRSPAMRPATVAAVVWMSALFFISLCRNLAGPRPANGRCGRSLRGALSRLGGPSRVAGLMGLFLAVFIAAHLPPLLLAAKYRQALPAGISLWRLACLSGLYFAIYAVLGPLPRNIAAAAVLSLVLAGAAWGLGAFFASVTAGLTPYKTIFGHLSGVVLFLLWLNMNAALVFWGNEFLIAFGRNGPPGRLGGPRPGSSCELSR
jgi:uncharacterized BrkB/YihY/UPF0761 family membrane protein